MALLFIAPTTFSPSAGLPTSFAKSSTAMSRISTSTVTSIRRTFALPPAVSVPSGVRRVAGTDRLKNEEGAYKKKCARMRNRFHRSWRRPGAFPCLHPSCMAGEFLRCRLRFAASARGFVGRTPELGEATRTDRVGRNRIGACRVGFDRGCAQQCTQRGVSAHGSHELTHRATTSARPLRQVPP